MKIYIAGASNELDMCAGYMQTIRDMGHSISFDWVSVIRKSGSGANPRDVPTMTLKKWALDDIRGVNDATILWLLVPQENSIGCWVELGYALAMRQFKPELIVVASGDYKRSIFTALCDFQFQAHDQALQWIQTIGNEQMRFVNG